jgi:hypothetical protein
MMTRGHKFDGLTRVSFYVIFLIDFFIPSFNIGLNENENLYFVSFYFQ